MLIPIIAIVLFFIFMYKARMVWYRDVGKLWRYTSVLWAALAVGVAVIGVASALSPKF